MIMTKIDGARLWQSLMDMARIGATPEGGSCREALTDADHAGRELFADWCRAEGCTMTTDAVGNLFVHRPGGEPGFAPVVMGSHLDTQPTGGRFDGVYGVLSALEVLRTLNHAGIATRHPIEIAVWMNEEGARFSPPMMGSGVFTGQFTERAVLDAIAQDGARLENELIRLGWHGKAPATLASHPVAAYFEAHIEQGPLLETRGHDIGVVTGAQGQRWFEVTVTGREAHAGPTPMELRRDALVAAARLVLEVQRIGLAYGGSAMVGVLDVMPHSRNVIPGRVFLTVDLRHASEDVLAEMEQDLRTTAARLATAGIAVDLSDFWRFPVTPFDPELVGRVRKAAGAHSNGFSDIVSGAGHDAVYMARVVPTAMIFVPCEGGISHNPAENIRPEHAETGCAVLFDAVLATAVRI
jgi:N-carbamoyl-L-amino-acid hydrolase